MNNFIKQVIEEKFESKAQQRFFYSQAGKGGKKGKKWNKLAKEYSDKTDFENLPDQVEKEVDEIVDDKGNIGRSKIPTNFNTKGITQRKITDKVVKSGAGNQGSIGAHGNYVTLRFWAESEAAKDEKLLEVELDGTLGADSTILKPGGPAKYPEAKKKMMKLVGDDDEAEDRIEKMGYDKNLPDDKIRLVENPKKFMEEYIESILSKKNISNDIIQKDETTEEKEINPIVMKQLKSLKNTLKSNKLSVNDIINHLKNDE